MHIVAAADNSSGWQGGGCGMKQGHLTLLFFVMFISCFIFLWLEQVQYDKVLSEKQRTEQALITAIEKAGEEFTTVLNASAEKKKQTLENAFFDSLSISLGIFQEEEEQEKLRLYVPMLILAEEDGAYFYYIQECVVNGKEEFKTVWSDKIPYSGQEPPVEKYQVSEALEKAASDIITNHNYIASQYGISYSFYVPRFLENSPEELKFPILLAVFQGWPLTAAGNIFYENCIDTGGYLQEIERYTVIGPESLSVPTCIYHKITCEKLSEAKGVLLEESATEKEAVYVFGAFPCDDCINR